MFKRKYGCIWATLVLLALAISMLPSTGKVKADEASATWRSTNGWPDEWNTYWPDESDVSYDVCYYIFQCFNYLNYE